MDIRIGVISHDMISSALAPSPVSSSIHSAGSIHSAPSALKFNTRPALLITKWSWDNEAEEAYPQWTTFASGEDLHGCTIALELASHARSSFQRRVAMKVLIVIIVIVNSLLLSPDTD